MSDNGQIKLLGFAGTRAVPDPVGLRKAMTAELSEMKATLGHRMTVICGAAPGSDLVFLRACVELRIPAIVIMPFPEERFAEDFADQEEWVLARHLAGVALAKYVAPGGHQAPQAYAEVSRHLLDWADAFLFADDGNDPGGTIREARELGIPARIIEVESLEARWEIPPDRHRNARHGFEARADLLDFLDARFAMG